ncbi:MAG TPA: hypothetical protein VHV28_18060 [Solirubrobacteraceae bacterium]|nr:hypothetical protein [Solirubrobacteraceae bacterium]
MCNYNFTPAESWQSYELGNATAAAGSVTPITSYDPGQGFSRVYFPAASGQEDLTQAVGPASLTNSGAVAAT